MIGSLGSQHQERLGDLPVDEQFQRLWVGTLQAPDVSDPVAREPYLEVVLSVLRERVGKGHAAARSDREAGYMLFLREVRRRANHVALE